MLIRSLSSWFSGGRSVRYGQQVELDDATAAARIAAGLAEPVLGASAAPSAAEWRAVSTRSSYPGAISGFTSGLKGSCFSRLAERIPSRAGVTAVRLRFINAGGGTNAAGAAGEVDGAPLTISAAIEVNPASKDAPWASTLAADVVDVIPATFSGSLTAVVAPGAYIDSDPIYYPLDAGQLYYTRTWVKAGGSGVIPANRVVVPADLEVLANYSFALATISSSATAATAISGTITAGGGIPVTLPLVPGSVGIRSVGGVITKTTWDAGDGTFPASNGLAAGCTINYATGAVSLNLSAALAPNAVRTEGMGANGTDAVDQTQTAPLTNTQALTNQQVMGPHAVLGLVPSTGDAGPAALLAVGDSITFGLGNTTELNRSWIDYSAAGGIGFVKIGQSSETAGTFALPRNARRRMAFAGGAASRAVCAYGANDLAMGATTLASLQANTLAVWGAVAATLPGGWKSLYAATVLPRTTSSGSQTPFNANYTGANSVRNQYNAWLLTQVGVAIAGVVDIAAAVETTPGSNTWSASSLTADGTHPSYAGYQALAALVGRNGTAPHPLFVG